MQSEGTIEIPLSKTKIALMLFGSLVFVACGFWFVISPPHIRHPIFGNPAVLLVTGILAIVFFGLCAVIAVRKLFDKAAGLTISDEGITDNSSRFSNGLVAWTDVVEIRKQNLMNQNFLVFIVKNPDEYLSRQTNPLKRKTMAMNLKSYGSPISISANTLNTNFDGLYEIVQRKFNETKT